MCNPTTLQSYLFKKKERKKVTTIPSLVCPHSTDLCSICFCFVLSISIIPSDVETQMSVVHPTQLTRETTLSWSAAQDVVNYSFVVRLLEARKRRGRGCAVFLLCAVLLLYAKL